jgi:integrase
MKACQIAKVEFFVPYTFRHTRLTRWSECMNPYTLAYLAGHSDFDTTKRYVYPQAETIRAAIARAEVASSRNKIRHSAETSEADAIKPIYVIQ